MAKLKDRNRQIPSGLKYRDGTTGWRARPFTSFDRIVEQLIAVRRANPHITSKYNLSLDPDAVANEVDAFNAMICQKMGWFDYIVEYDPSGEIGGSAVPFTVRPSPNTERLKSGGVVAEVKNLGAGVALVADWLGDELLPVESALANQRAHVCAMSDNPPDENGKVNPGCPQNQDPNFLGRITGRVAEEIRSLISVHNQMELRTAYDAQLHECKACSCYLPLKVWAPLGHIKAHMRAEVMEKLDPRCWILRELANADIRRSAGNAATPAD